MPPGPAVPCPGCPSRTAELTVAFQRLALVLLALAVLIGCSRSKRYPLEGQVLAVDHTRGELTVMHGDIRGFMPGMTMPFKVRDPEVLKARKPGDLIRATLVVADSYGILEDVRHTGEAPIPPGAEVPAATSIIPPGHPVTDASFIDHHGKPRSLAGWRGRTVAVTFIYTRCPLPDFCPLMDRQFAAVQKGLESDPRLSGKVQLLSVSFDPGYDTPEVLRAHAGKVGAHETVWTFLTGEAAAIDRFAAQFGVTVMRPDRPLQEITHNLRTAVIDAEGRLVKIFNGRDWKPEELLDALRAPHVR